MTTDRVRRVQELRRSNAAGKHKQVQPCQHKHVRKDYRTSAILCLFCGEDMGDPWDTTEEWRGDK